MIKHIDGYLPLSCRFPVLIINNISEIKLSILTLFKRGPVFLRVCIISILETLWEKEKLLVTCDFSFSHSVFYPFIELFAIFV